MNIHVREANVMENDFILGIFTIIITHKYKISYNLKFRRTNQSMIFLFIPKKSYQNILIIIKYPIKMKLGKTNHSMIS